ncbi:MAG: CoA transferase [Acidobacteriota bacterium]|nr:CoA transferase [Acidobacteriota bacterium]
MTEPGPGVPGHPDPPFYGGADRRPRERRGPLSGIRVADFCWMGVGSVATRLLADFGAEVIKIEDRTRVDMPRRLPLYKDQVRSFGQEVSDPDPDRGGLFNNYSRNKLGVTINLRTQEGRELAEKLISVSSVVTENFAPGVMERWGFTYERLRQLVPDVIYARMSGYGHSGPHQHYRSYGPVVQAASGLSYVAGLPGREPSGWGLSYMDNMAAYYNSAALLMAIWKRQSDGLGTEIDVAAVELGVTLLGPILLDVTVNGHTTRRPDYPTGNRLEHPNAAPHGVYPCAGDDRWVAIAVFDDSEWLRLVEAIGHPAWTDLDIFSSQDLRHAHQDALDEQLSLWTRQYDPIEAMELLESKGVKAGAVQNPQDLNERDPQLSMRGTFFEMDHPVIGPARFEGFPALMSGDHPDHWRSAPLVGEDNDYVFGEILGLSEQERADLLGAGVI